MQLATASFEKRLMQETTTMNKQLSVPNFEKPASPPKYRVLS